MFQSSARRLRALLSLADDILGDPEPTPAPHPHRRPARVTYQRRRGSVPAAPAHCLSPVRPKPAAPHRTKVS